ncbi:hypothetical protein NDU88_004121 [Pleurodeles waltl]|uniref:Uncharacterized protein n=1 Tax=Pleurodeles waltl TaxID=8319 RepID=A0AAV7T7G4_PLEWA|nr:hypothetical protein NDU88_004121 [Pleurodeles waltl]
MYTWRHISPGWRSGPASASGSFWALPGGLWYWLRQSGGNMGPGSSTLRGGREDGPQHRLVLSQTDRELQTIDHICSGPKRTIVLHKSGAQYFSCWYSLLQACTRESLTAGDEVSLTSALMAAAPTRRITSLTPLVTTGSPLECNNVMETGALELAAVQHSISSPLHVPQDSSGQRTPSEVAAAKSVLWLLLQPRFWTRVTKP